MTDKQTDEALEALATLESQPLVGGHGDTYLMGELYPTAFAKVRGSLEQQREEIQALSRMNRALDERLAEFDGQQALEAWGRYRRNKYSFRESGRWQKEQDERTICQALERQRELEKVLTQLLSADGDHMTACDQIMGATHPCTCGADEARRLLAAAPEPDDG